MGRKNRKHGFGILATIALAVCLSVGAVAAVGSSNASANSADDYATAGGFGMDAATATATASNVQSNEGSDNSGQTSEPVVREASVLSSPATRNMTNGTALLDEKDRVIAQQKAEEEATVQTRVQYEKDIALSTYGSMPSSLEEVDWSVGKDAFIAEWTERIDNYLEGTALEGYGATFAEAAWENGVDPRWSPAISNTESGNGKQCFLSHNAWGWGQSSWSDWDTAIREHVKGLATVYGYTITQRAAAVYCPPNSQHWYENTLSQMKLI